MSISAVWGNAARDPQDSPVTPILFLIYISGVFDQGTKMCTLVTSLSFIDYLGFIASGSSVKEVGKALEKVAIIVIEWVMQNAVTYDTFENGSGFVFKGTSAKIQ